MRVASRAIGEGRRFLVAKQIQQTSEAETPHRAWLIGLAAWAVPGLGHLLQRRWARALLLGGAVWAMFFTGYLAMLDAFDLAAGRKQ